jgi:dihydropteroate synthase
MKKVAVKIMGIINTTPDSFYDGGRYNTKEGAVSHALKLENDGADILDIGGESTRPGADFVSVEEELSRVVPVVKDCVTKCNVPISVDTTKSEVAEQCLKSGAQIINDISGMTFDEKMLEVAVSYNATIILMHTKGIPKTMQKNTNYSDIISVIEEFLSRRVEKAVSVGIPKEKIIIDPGIGFGKSVEQNYLIINEIPRFRKIGCRVLIGLSRKSLIGNIQNNDEDRLPATLILNTMAVDFGVDIIRVHDVKEHVLAMKAYQKLLSCRM